MGEWISVKDRLPEIGERVAVLVNYANSENEHEDELIEDDEWMMYAWECVTHWMPLPDPPQKPSP